MQKHDYNAILSIMMDAAIEAGYLTINSTPEQRKDLFIADDRVTIIDIEAENVIIKILKDNFADLIILSEETHKKNREPVFHNIDKFTGFLVDPIDGSVNFSRMISKNYGNFAVSIGFAENGIIKAGVIYKPLENEMFHAVRGNGAFQDNNQIHVSQIDNINHASIELGSYWIREKPDLFNRWFTNKKTDVEQILIRGSAAVGLADVARGRIEAILHSKLHPWDYAAGWIIVEEAGGIVMDGNCNSLRLGGKFIYATNKNLNETVKRILKGEFK